jgi:hypothetical protein
LVSGICGSWVRVNGDPRRTGAYALNVVWSFVGESRNLQVRRMRIVWFVIDVNVFLFFCLNFGNVNVQSRSVAAISNIK